MPFDPLSVPDLCRALSSGDPAVVCWALEHAEAVDDPKLIDPALDAWAQLEPSDDLRFLVPDAWVDATRIDRLVGVARASDRWELRRSVLYQARSCATANALAFAADVVAGAIEGGAADERTRQARSAAEGHAAAVLCAHGDAAHHGLLRRTRGADALAALALRQGSGAFDAVIDEVLFGARAADLIAAVWSEVRFPEELASPEVELEDALAVRDRAEDALAAWKAGPAAVERWLDRPAPASTPWSDALDDAWDSASHAVREVRALRALLASCRRHGRWPPDPVARAMLAIAVGRADGRLWLGAELRGNVEALVDGPEAEARRVLDALLACTALLDRLVSLSEQIGGADDWFEDRRSAAWVAIELAVARRPSLCVGVLPRLAAALAGRDVWADEVARSAFQALGDAHLALLCDPARPIHPLVLADIARAIRSPRAYRMLFDLVPADPDDRWRRALVMLTRPEDVGRLLGALDRTPRAFADAVLADLRAVHGADVADGVRPASAGGATEGARRAAARAAARKARRQRRR